MMVQNHGCGAKAARRLLADWIVNGMVATRSSTTTAKAQGLKVLAWPG